MAGTVNKVILIGHTGDDVKVTYFEGGGAIGRFPLATNEDYINKNTGERVSNTEWHNIVVRNKGAEICEKYLKKGDKVYVEGRLKTRKWQDQNGQDRYSTEIQCIDFTFLSPKGESQTGNQNTGYTNNQPATPKPSTPTTNTTPQSSFTPETPEEDDLPF